MLPADATVALEDGSVKRMDALSIGDRVQVGNGRYSDVFMFSHKVYNIVRDFVTVTTSSGASLSATDGHYIYLHGKQPHGWLLTERNNRCRVVKCELVDAATRPIRPE